MAFFGKEKPSIRDIATLNAVTPSIEESRKMLAVDELCCAVIWVNQYQTENSLGWLDCLVDSANMPLSIRLDPVSTAALRDSVDMHEKQVFDKMLARNMTASKEDALAREQSHGRRMLEMAGDEGARFFNVSISAVVRAETEDKLMQQLRYLHSVCQSKGLDFTIPVCNQLTGFMAASPARTPDPDGVEISQFPMPSTTLGYSLFCRDTGLVDPHGILLGHDKLAGLVRVNIVERTPTRMNSNIVIFGGSGSGKSTLAKKLSLWEYLLWGSRIICIDPEGEMVGIAKALGGEVIKVGGKSGMKLSPLQPRAISEDEEADGGEDVEDEDNALAAPVLRSTIPFAKSFLQIAFKIDDNLMDLLEIGLERAYSKYGITMDTTFAEYYSKRMSYPVMEDLFAALGELRDADDKHAVSFDRLALKIRSAARGVNAEMWNSRSDIAADADFVVISTENMDVEENIKQAQYYNLLSWVWSEVRTAPASGKPIRIVIDEAHNVVNANTPAAAEMVKSMVKRIRKRGGGTTIITQEVVDFLDPAIKAQGAAICNNATYKFFGQADGDNIKELAKLYAMPSELEHSITEAHKGEFAFFAGTAERTWLKVDIDKWESDLFGKGGGT